MAHRIPETDKELSSQRVHLWFRWVIREMEHLEEFFSKWKKNYGEKRHHRGGALIKWGERRQRRGRLKAPRRVESGFRVELLGGIKRFFILISSLLFSRVKKKKLPE